jgi:hypothetical protein
MPRKTSPNISFYHYRIDFYDETNEKMVAQKYYYTLSDICNEFDTSTFTIYRIMKNKINKVFNNGLKNTKIFYDKQPVFKLIRNDEIYGELDDIEHFMPEAHKIYSN